MLRPRIIPCLLVHDKGLVKTEHFKNPRYLGDPMNAVRIFNEKEVDELIILDIDATVEGRGPDFKMIEHWAEECRMPLCYGGGVTTVEQAQRIFSLGVEKIAFSAGAINNPDIIKEISEKVGSQSVVVVLDVKKKLFGGYEVYTHNGKKATGKSPFELIKMFEQLGAGEIVINSIDRDGEMKGYDMKLIETSRNETTLPLTAIGGAGKLEDVGELISKFGIIGAAAGSLFVFKGKLKAVLINYPNFIDKESLIKKYF
ncbi:AglZ/HisF2 family acetamidino modification protein [Chryseobacterium oranimense]|uniref:AglZ/HisF2 family acetamidino modification protein n=1 Tax=Chryseobacterium oranimense TaxID=421058 RepID=UPI0021B05037|nr:AglZ/HisF2 family acetamidino modification protein [Chryseobacterium oranimense]UWX60788.1 AglZ/HisF2 family acetamidino modification protein [Chryseobacterium oranimense]